MMTTKRAYKLQEFVAHASNVNCLKIGRKTSRVLVTGGEDRKVNLWAIGKPNAILRLSGHTSAVESVNFDSSEALVAAGAANGTIKLWDLVEAKVVCTLTGHRSNCISVDFHPFGEFIASGSLDTNLKIWDVRRKGCIDTYKGHSGGINAIRFTPDGRWVVSGGEDNIVKLWDLTAGKLLHDFKCHEGQIQCVDFHPHEFLLATGSADKTVKFWDLETFEMIGSSGPEQVEPYAGSGVVRLNGHSESNSDTTSNQSLKIDSNIKTSMGRLSISQDSVNSIKTTMGRLLVSETVVKGTKPLISPGIPPGIPQRTGLSSALKMAATNSATAPGTAVLKTSSSKFDGTTNFQNINKSDVVPVIVPRTSLRADVAADSRKEMDDVVHVPKTNSSIGLTLDRRKHVSNVFVITRTTQSKVTDLHKFSNNRFDSERANVRFRYRSMGNKSTESNENVDCNLHPPINGFDHTSAGKRNLENVQITKAGKAEENLSVDPQPSYLFQNNDPRLIKPREANSMEVLEGGRTQSLVMTWERREKSPSYEGPTSSNSSQNISTGSINLTSVVRQLWDRNDLKGVIRAMEKISDYAVSADILSILMEKGHAITLDLYTCLLPLLASLLESKIDRYTSISLEMLLKLIKIFGPVIHSALSAVPSVGVDLQAEERLEKCNLCFIELEKIKHIFPSLTRRGGSIAESVQELNLTLQEVL
ncbi:katanin p80 WD40 repeat-containing subunit B1 homolog KTN80.3 isoform X2 [Elaeis guineensis]|uniref:katanin p80 WD40 repeat-containing subunit B1 homolog KTN80.3 isoform X2 n=1 Tax=Elaeis guineensis var. tenera TaxID=51953 RepID=UPI003C6D7D8A